MANWYKGNKNIIFGLRDLEVNEEFSIWKAWDKRNDEVKDLAGQVMKFPIKEGQLTAVDGKVMELHDVKMMKAADFKVAFPELSKNTKYQRNVVIGGVEYVYSFAYSANKKLDELIDSCKAMGSEALSIMFEQTYDSQASPAQKYGMKVSSVRHEMPQQNQPATPTQQPVADAVVSSQETDIIEAIKGTHGVDASEEMFVSVMKDNKIEEARAKVLYTQHYKK